ncbi:MAG: hypothetical protein N2C12_13390, partial [Planctomycetales bacterium]
PTGSDMAIRLHESFVNNFAAVALGGTTFSSEQAENSANESELLNKIRQQRQKNMEERRQAEGLDKPVGAKAGKEQAPWEMVFARQNPISVEFRNGTVKFTIRGVKFLGLDDETFKNSMSMWAVYDVALDKYGGLQLTLKEQGVDPTNVERGGKLRAGDAIVRAKLRARMKAALEGPNGEKRVVDIFPLELPSERGEKIGKMAYTLFEAKDGWLTIAWDRTVKKEQRQAKAEDKGTKSK